MHPLWAQQATLVRTLQTVLCRLQLQGMTPNRCDEQDCNEVIDEEHFLCRRHWQQFMEGEIAECFQCGEFKPTSFPLCRRCNAEATNRPTRAPQTRRTSRAEPQRPSSNTRRAYDHHDGADDQKAKDKRYWFNRQNNGICNYCGNRHPYDQLEMEHMIPRELGGPDTGETCSCPAIAVTRKRAPQPT